MKTLNPTFIVKFASAAMCVVLVALGSPGALAADPPHQHPDAPLEEQVAALRDKVAKLEAALNKGLSPKGSMPQMSGGSDAAMQMASPGMDKTKMGMGGMDKGMEGKTGGMGMKKMPDGGAMGDMEMQGGMGGMMEMGGMDKMMMGMKGMGMMGMDGMKMMGGMGGGATMTSALPGFPGASHLYHIGATGFFLDHAEHITLTSEQQSALNKIKESALLAKATAERKIAEANQDLWQLTAADEPDATKIDAKIAEIEKLSAEQRRSFIGKVGEAAQVLTDEQRKALTGMAAPQPEGSMEMPSASPSPGMDPMPGM